ncbi:glycosyltransferase family 2 protein [Nocardioides sp.]|uniref:glycosyltransferase family 2 protein n=1 Tax=Nocardioides sp. TaxID=35761 RepID=UPI003D0DE8FB
MIDVLLPFYGDPGLLRRAVESVQAQTSADWRLLVVDDCYPGESVEPWLSSLGESRIVYSRNPENLGVNRNFQHCLELAEADHVTFLGCDDLMLPRYVEVVGAAARRSSAAMVQCDVQVIDADGQPVRTLTDAVKRRLMPDVQGSLTLSGEDFARRLLTGNWAYFPAICWDRRQALHHGFRPGLDLALDLALILDLVSAGADFVLLEEVCFAYRRHGDSASSVAAVDTRRFTEERAFFVEVAKRLDERGWPRAARAARMHLTSRLHAAALLPAAVRTRDRVAVRSLFRHLAR